MEKKSRDKFNNTNISYTKKTHLAVNTQYHCFADDDIGDFFSFLAQQSAQKANNRCLASIFLQHRDILNSACFKRNYKIIKIKAK